MSRARDRADGVDLSSYATLASPAFTGTPDFSGVTAFTHKADMISGDAVSGGEIGAGTFSGSIGDSATMSNNCWAHGKIDGVDSLSASTGNGEYVYSDGSGSPYLVWQHGSDATTTASGKNFCQGSSTTKFKIVKAGVYFMSWSVVLYTTGSGVTRFFKARIRDGSDNDLAQALDQVDNADSSAGDFGNAVATLCMYFTANSEIKLNIFTDAGANLTDETHFSIGLIRPG